MQAGLLAIPYILVDQRTTKYLAFAHAQFLELTAYILWLTVL